MDDYTVLSANRGNLNNNFEHQLPFRYSNTINKLLWELGTVRSVGVRQLILV